MELAQSTYLKTETAPFEYDLQKAEKMRMVLQQILETLESFARSAS
jgi:formiminoglutamase